MAGKRIAAVWLLSLAVGLGGCVTTTPSLPGKTGGVGLPSPSSGLTLIVINNSGQADADVYLALIAGGGVVMAPSTKLTDLRKVGDKTYAYDLTADANNGRLWVSFKQPLSGLPGTQPDPNSTTGPRWDIVELSYPGPYSVANLSAVDGVGIPMDLTTFDSTGQKESLTFTCYAQELTTQLQKQFAAIGRDFTGVVKYQGGVVDPDHYLRIVSPSKLVPASSSQGYPDMGPYVKSMAALGTITVHGYYYGPAAQQGEYLYKGRFDADGNITLNGTLPPNNGPAYALAVTGKSLYAGTIPGVYGQTPNYTVNGQPSSANDVYAAIFRDLTAAFSWGYWGGKYGGGTDATAFVNGPIDPPGASHATGEPPFAAARATKPAFVAYNLYASTLYQFSQAYSFPYADTFANKKPQASLTGGVNKLQITLHPFATPHDAAHQSCFQ